MVPTLPFDRDGKSAASLSIGPLPSTITIPGLGINLNIGALKKDYLQPRWIAAAAIPVVLAFLYYQ
jgi:hypothetical protein